MTKPSYEMLWDCPACGTKKLLGVTHRHCPSCGRPQDPKSRYFPKDGEEIAINEHVFVGADWQCSACQSANGARAKYCASCGCDTAGSKSVALKEDPSQIQRASSDVRINSTALPSSSKSGSSSKFVLALVLMAIFGGSFLFFKTKKQKAQVVNHSWELLVDIEEYKRELKKLDCADVKDSSKIVSKDFVSRSMEVPNGKECNEVCEERKVDQGDGSFRKERDCKEECTPRKKLVKAMVAVCAIENAVWTKVRSEQSKGVGQTPEPSWPVLNLKAGDGYGKQRIGKKSEFYRVELVLDSKPLVCQVPRTTWYSVKSGTKLDVKVNALGVAFCPF